MIISAKTTEPPPSVAQINDIELSILSRQTSYLDQGTQTEGPRVPTIPLPDVPGTSDGIGFSDVAGVLESESPGYTYIRDSQHIFQAPVENLHWRYILMRMAHLVALIRVPVIVIILLLKIIIRIFY